MIPSDFKKVLSANDGALAAWKSITPVAQRDFVSWIVSAKRPETRAHRIEKACSMLAAGKRRPCCYAVVPMDLYTELSAHRAARVQWKQLTPMERRSFTDWIQAETNKDTQTSRIKRVCQILASGGRQV